MRIQKQSWTLGHFLCPENFRFFESSIYGCVTIASENLPNNWIYQSNHYLKVNWQNTKQIVDLISELITNKEKLQQYSLKSYDTWNNLYDSTKIADYIESKILEYSQLIKFRSVRLCK